MKMQSFNRVRGNVQSGFTLIELIVVIVILGILAATALPKFADLGGDARRASLQAARGSLQSVSAMVHGRALMTSLNGTIIMEGTTVNIKNGYPQADAALVTAAGLGSTADWTQVTAAAGATSPGPGTNAVTVVPTGILNTAQSLTCYVRYTEGATAAVAPVIESVTGGC